MSRKCSPWCPWSNHHTVIFWKISPPYRQAVHPSMTYHSGQKHALCKVCHRTLVRNKAIYPAYRGQWDQLLDASRKDQRAGTFFCPSSLFHNPVPLLRDGTQVCVERSL